MTKSNVPRESDWLVLVAMMLMYRLPTQSLKGTQDQKQKYNLEWPWHNMVITVYLVRIKSIIVSLGKNSYPNRNR